MEENKNKPPEQPPANIPEATPATPPSVEQPSSLPENILSEQNQEPIPAPSNIETPVTQQPQTPNPKPQTELMDVHHHTHPGHHKKKWTDYFWEFLMLFLAVFCGFLAEYQLEHKIEKDRELQYITSLTSDLQDDINGLDAMISFERLAIRQLDTLMYLLNDPVLAKQNGDQLYYVARLGPRAQPFANNSRTFDQLRNSGGFRLITNTEASNTIMSYYNQFSPVRLLENNYNLEFDNYKRVAAKIFDPFILRRQENDLGDILRSSDNPALRTYDADLLKELGFHALQMNGSRRGKIVMLENLKKTAGHLKSYLQKKYQLE